MYAYRLILSDLQLDVDTLPWDSGNGFTTDTRYFVQLLHRACVKWKILVNICHVRSLMCCEIV